MVMRSIWLASMLWIGLHATPTAAESLSQCQLPGAAPLNPKLCAKLHATRIDPPDDYPRSRHRSEEGDPLYLNRLALESSPYLRQHAFNPVNWYPWGDEAFDAARRLGRPVLLSIGYSTCHWCHVMEEESFEDLEIAEFLNRNYIAIKVDREERPDIDTIYMTAVQAMTGRGGWPMTSWLTADREPFFGGTYFPARDGERGSRIGFLTLLRRMNRTFQEQPEAVRERGSQLAATIRTQLEAERSAPSKRWALSRVDAVAERFNALIDDRFGGVRGAPKFPATFPVRLMLRHATLRDDERSLASAIKTLEGMSRGGLFDPIGGGFHRYTVDAEWRIPHFEKMLYDNAQLVLAFLEGWQLTDDPHYRSVVVETLDYLVREMRSPSGAFYAATDADSLTPDGELEEGRFFSWTPAEVDAALPPAQREVAKSYFGIGPPGNLEGRSVPYRPIRVDELAKRVQQPESELRADLKQIRARMYAVRAQREAPLRDEKLLTSWNGLAISAFARAGFVLDRDDYLQAARQAAQAILSHREEGGRLRRTGRGGAAFLEDYTFLIAGLLDLFEATGEARWIEAAWQLQEIQDREFGSEEGSYFRTSRGHERLLARQRPMEDGAIPSGNSIAVSNLLRFTELSGDASYRERADRVVGGANSMLLSVAFAAAQPIEVVLVYRGEAQRRAEPFLDALRSIALRPAVQILVDESNRENRARLEARLPMVQRKRARKRGVTAYVCQEGLCELPTSDLETFRNLLGRSSKVAEPRKK